MSEESNAMISVVVPIYNAEMWLAECIDSICGQSYYCLEILLIDDGSTDASRQICRSKAEQDKRIRVIEKENSGVSETRNLGLSLAKGEYLTFVDADDYLHPRALEFALESMKDGKAQLCIWNAACVRKAAVEPEPDIPEGRISCRDAVTAIVYDRCADVKLGRYFRASWGKLYRMDVIRNENIRFSPQQRIGEDALFLLDYISHIEYIVGINHAGYYYRITNTSAVRRYREDLLEQNQQQLDSITTRLKQFPDWEGTQLDTALTCLAWDMFRRLVRNNLLAKKACPSALNRKQNDAKLWYRQNRHILRQKNISRSLMPRKTRLQYFLSGWVPVDVLCEISARMEKTE